VLTDLERIAPCMPGAELQEVEGDEYRGIVKVKVGPISAQYKGSARFIEKDDDRHRAVLLAEGRDTRGQGNASATVTAIATPDGDGTTVSLVTDLAITGKVAQFGRSIMGDVSAKMLGEFADRLEADVLSQGSGPERSEPVSGIVGGTKVTPHESDTQSVRTIHSAPAEPVDLLGTAGPSVMKRVAPLAALLSLALLLWLRQRRRRNARD
jgi:carbon monoxide dehydrogenase subunit G